ncbi:hypothetical protein AURDEDRAFT_182995 [Auricularia subglabra TFB-10046 SS5]|nr:hypothetical protein AURDEDRAFT_182995 [Auricularia subglabra TFB-10046 SS5]
MDQQGGFSVPSAKAQALAQSIEDMAQDCLSGVDSPNDVVDLFSALHRVMTRALSNVASAWNATHDQLRVLPPERQELCFEPLSLFEKCQLSLVCSHWLSTTRGIPSLWNDLDMTKCSLDFDFDALLARSGGLPLDLRRLATSTDEYLHLVDRTLQSHTTDEILLHIDRCLKPHAHRLRTLHLIVKPIGGATVESLLRYPAPLLESLSLEYLASYDRRAPQEIKSPALLFNGHAPRLRSVHLNSIAIPSSCPALANIRSAIIQNGFTGLSDVFHVMPDLQNLEIVTPLANATLPRVPANSKPRRTFSFRLGHTAPQPTVAQLAQLGYLTATSCVVLYNALLPLIHAAAQLLPQRGGTPPSLVLNGQDLDLCLCPDDKRTLRVTCCAARIGCAQAVFYHPSAAFAHIERLELPRVPFRDCTHFNSLCPTNLPGVRTLVVRCGEDSPRSGGLLAVEFASLPLRLPALARLELVADASSKGPLRPVTSAQLVSFIEHDLELDNPARLELFVDTAGGVRLDGDLQRLRSCVARIHIAGVPVAAS